jgi:hypothetical protein
MSISDKISEVLAANPGYGWNDLVRKNLETNLSTTQGTVTDLWMRWFTTQGYTLGGFNDRAANYWAATSTPSEERNVFYLGYKAFYGTLPDTYWDNVSSYIRFNGVDGTTVYTDEKSITWTANGTTSPRISTTTSKFGGASLWIEGGSGYLTTPYTPAFQFTGDFTVEWWAYLVSDANPYNTFVSNYNVYGANGGFAVFADHAGGTANKYSVAFNGSYPVITSTSDVIYGQWVHFALVRASNVLTLYVNGVAEGSSTQTATVEGVGGSWYIGATGDSLATSTINGYIDEFRVTKDVARYTANFTPQTAQFANTGPAPVVLNGWFFNEPSQSGHLLTSGII